MSVSMSIAPLWIPWRHKSMGENSIHWKLIPELIWIPPRKGTSLPSGSMRLWDAFSKDWQHCLNSLLGHAYAASVGVGFAEVVAEAHVDDEAALEGLCDCDEVAALERLCA